jgi:hypothetical protein
MTTATDVLVLAATHRSCSESPLCPLRQSSSNWSFDFLLVADAILFGMAAVSGASVGVAHVNRVGGVFRRPWKFNAE